MFLSFCVFLMCAIILKVLIIGPCGWVEIKTKRSKWWVISKEITPEGIYTVTLLSESTGQVETLTGKDYYKWCNVDYILTLTERYYYNKYGKLVEEERSFFE